MSILLRELGTCAVMARGQVTQQSVPAPARPPSASYCAAPRRSLLDLLGPCLRPCGRGDGSSWQQGVSRRFPPVCASSSS